MCNFSIMIFVWNNTRVEETAVTYVTVWWLRQNRCKVFLEFVWFVVRKVKEGYYTKINGAFRYHLYTNYRMETRTGFWIHILRVGLLGPAYVYINRELRKFDGPLDAHFENMMAIFENLPGISSALWILFRKIIYTK